ncbi:uncharacterized protein si:dkey-245n4.2 isoform X2 [Dunckerocampus dactyliophorus]|uniref:uncharacterized protein si:dkey-245n4.2 isoform X2 n=1 Tax=Dunckerocampus dactyliophorus TaxID=161453 RepID=UPI0024053264|nr:uncharacterized protein si:dkey-245n4.2 isoform X2 [Dunckerocampus dactyliophorus]
MSPRVSGRNVIPPQHHPPPCFHSSTHCSNECKRGGRLREVHFPASCTCSEWPTVPIAAMGRKIKSVYLLPLLIFTEVSALKIRNKLLGTCLQVQDGTPGGRVSLGECNPQSALQEWLWLSGSQALSNHFTGECLTAPEEQFEGVHMQPCNVEGQVEEAGTELDNDAGSQKWSCTKKGHLTLLGRGLHLSATQESTLLFLSREHKQGSRWRTLDDQTLCDGRDSNHHHHNQHHHSLGKSMEHAILPITDMDRQAADVTFSNGITEGFSVRNVSDVLFLSTKSPADPTMVFFSMDYGMGWKITMLVLSSLALVLGTVILILNVYSNRRKKVVCVLKSYTPRPEAGVPGSPVPNERAPLTEHAMCLPLSSPTLQRGEILIEWKDGTVTPLYEA